MDCPRCKEDLPLLSNICSLCGYVVEDENDDSGSPRELAIVLEDILREVKGIPQPSFARGMQQYAVYALPVIALFLLVISVMTAGLLFWILFVCVLSWSIYTIVKKVKGTLGNDPFNRRFEELIHDFDYNKSIALMKYGKNREISKLVDNISEEIWLVNEYRKKMGRKNLILWVVVFAVLFVIASLLTNKTSDVVSSNVLNNATFEEITQMPDLEGLEWETIVSKFNEIKSPNRDLERKLVEIALEKGNFAYAIEYFESNILSKPGDYVVATMMIDFLRTNSQGDLVESLKSKCVGKFRYSSDNDKFKKQ